MGLLDSVLGGVLGQTNPAQAGESGQTGQTGMNPKMMLALGLLAMLAMRGRQGGAEATQDPGGMAGGLGGILGGLAGGGGGLDLGSLLGGLLGGQGGAAGEAQTIGAAAGGIGALQQILAQAGLGEQVSSWIGTGPNQPVSPSSLAEALQGTGALDTLSSTTGLSRDDVAAQLSAGLPELIDQLTPQGQVPPAA